MRPSNRAFVAGLLALGMLGAGCAQRSTSSTTTLVPLVGPRAATTTTEAATTLPPTTLVETPVVDSLPDGKNVSCAFADPAPAGEITFEIGTRLWAVAPDGSELHCLSTLKSGQLGPLRWAPKADQAVLTKRDPTTGVVSSLTVLSAAGRKSVGFGPLAGFDFVQPDGTALLGTSASGRTLSRRATTGTGGSTTITFLASTWMAVSHPAGGVVIAAGKAADGTLGVFAAPEGGGKVTTLMTLADKDTTVSDLVVDAGGSALYAVLNGTSTARLIRLELDTLLANEVASDQQPLSGLVAGPVEGTIAWRSGLCNSTTSSWIVDTRTGTPVQVGAGSAIAGLSSTPIGWLDATRLLVATRPLGCDGPFDLWIWSSLDGVLAPVVSGVDAAAARVIGQTATAFGVRPGAEAQRV